MRRGKGVMAANIDPLDVGALERSVNDSAGRVSGIWLAFVASSAYVAAAASMITHRQLFLEGTIKLPTINIDLPLLASAILMPLLFVIYHIYVLLQVVLLARTADAYNQALDRSIAESGDRTLMRQRLANTLFAQIFAGSPREREGVLGWLLRLMAWITLAIGPVLVLLVFQIKLLPYHDAAVTWTHRGLIAVDLLAILLLWTGAVDPKQEISARSLLRRPWIAATTAVCFLLWCALVTLPGEPTRTLMRQFSQTIFLDHDYRDCWAPPFVAFAISDSLFLQQQDFVDPEKLSKIVTLAKANGLPPYKSGRTLLLRGRDLRCGQFGGADLRRADFSAADLSGASLKGAHLEGAVFTGARLQQANLDAAQLQDAYFAAEEDENVKDSSQLLKPATMPGASLQEAKLQGASFKGAALHGARFPRAELYGANLDEAEAQRAIFSGAKLAGATLQSAKLQAADLVTADALGASFANASLQGAILGSAYLGGADFESAMLQGTRFNNARMPAARFVKSAVWRATNARCDDALVADPDFGVYIALKTVQPPPGARRAAEIVAIAPDPAAIEEFIATASRSLPDGAADQLRTRLLNRLAPNESETATTERAWKACADKADATDEYPKRRLELYIRAICTSDPNSRYIAEGIARLKYRLLDAPNVKALAVKLLKPDECPGARDLSPATKAELLEAAK